MPLFESGYNRAVQLAVAKRLSAFTDWRVDMTPPGFPYDYRIVVDGQILGFAEHKDRTNFLSQAKYRALRMRLRDAKPVYGEGKPEAYFVVSFTDCLAWAELEDAVRGLRLEWMRREAPREGGGTADTDREQGFYVPVERMAIFDGPLTEAEITAAQEELERDPMMDRQKVSITPATGNVRDLLPPPPGYRGE